ncbi:site-specific DNA-methyltransferase [Hylemonella gracilis]|uniref:site-specific DNA-methyltransferase (adenine-specific) n=1 Tax=Hylemonella gracilis ATCC 19624 TaxID=887062 RepID=F3KXS4_9BURK|nr:DNA methyltransferase [Hylemonella gracilis]EGI75349.1 DNA methylase N-4/N-6 domain-containing protein [Hylemonella gracilis ATCC 19624]
MATRKPKAPLQVETLKHDDATRKNIPTAEYQSILRDEDKAPIRVAYERRNQDLDPQLVWRGKDVQDWSDLVVHAPPLYIQEKVHPKVLIDDLKRQTEAAQAAAATQQQGFVADLFADFNGLPSNEAKTEFYQHDAHWANRMILGDSLAVMASLAEREGLRGKVQCIYFDPPYGIKFNSNFQWSTTSRDVKDGNAGHITREPEQVKAFRDTWRDGIHSYLTYLRDRLTVARDLLTDSGSIFVQIGDENVHRVRAVMDEVFGDENCITEILVKKKGSQKGGTLDPVNDFILWYGKQKKSSNQLKIRPIYEVRSQFELLEDFPFIELSDGRRLRLTELEELDGFKYSDDLAALERRYPASKLFAANPLKSGGNRRQQSHDFKFRGRTFPIKPGQCWKHTVIEDDGSTPGMERLGRADRLHPQNTDVRFVRHSPQPSIREISNWWDGFGGASNQIYVVQTNERVVQRCLLLATDPGDLVLDITCGSGTTAYVAEQWGRRWITIDTSRVALALARARIMGARYPYYLLADSREGQLKVAEVTQRAPASSPVRSDVRLGFVYEHVTNTTSGDIANNIEIDVIWEKFQAVLEPLRFKLNELTEQQWQEWEVPRDIEPHIPTWLTSGFQQRVTTTPVDRNARVQEIRKLHADWWAQRIARQKEIDASIAAKAEFEFLYDKPYEDKKKVRVAGPFTVESLSPHRTLGVDENGDVMDGNKAAEPEAGYGGTSVRDFAAIILENLRTAGVQQAHKQDRISFTALTPWPGSYVCGEGRYTEGEGGAEKRAAIFIGPEFGTVSRPDLVSAAKEAGDAGFDVLVACAFNYDAHSSEFEKLGRIPVLKARMNADLHMAEDLKNTGKGNLFVIFGEPDITILDAATDQPFKAGERATGELKVKVNGVDVFDPSTGEVRSDGADGIACWFIDTDYNEESFFVRHAYFLGANDPYKSLKTTLKAEINQEAWDSLNSDVSRPFDKPSSGRIAVKVINHLGDEVMKVFRV